MAKHIYYFCHPQHTYTLGIFAAYWATDTAAAIRIVPYNFLPTIPAFGGGAFILTDFDRMPEQQRERVALLADRLQGAGGKVLNHPKRTLRRFELLRALHRAGINDFNVYRLEEWQSVQRFPVFIRHTNQNRRPLTDLLHDERALRQALECLPPELPGNSGRIIVEFGNVPTAEGRFVKYSAFLVGEADYASARETGNHWWVKFTDRATDQDLKEQRQFAQENPHRAQLLQVWQVGQAQYGRIDYCVVDGRVQVFEINTNPTVSYHPDGKMDRTIYSKPHEAALRVLLDSMDGGEPLRNPLFAPGGNLFTPERVHQFVLGWGRRNWSSNWDGSRMKQVIG